MNVFKKLYMIPVNPHTTEEKTKVIVRKQVTPMTAVEERAKKKLNEYVDLRRSH